ncbi:MAG TPA: CHAT domain-containing tetratricopeptide repeat protein [Chryseosolibacter sp.]
MKALHFTFALLLIVLRVHAQTVLEKTDELLLHSEYEKAIALADNANSLPAEEKLFLANKKAEALTRLGKLEDARALLNSLGGQGSDFVQAVTKTNLGLLYIYQGRYDLALESLQASTREFENIGKQNTLESAQAIGYLGQVYKYTGKSAQAEEQLRMALSIRQGILKEDHELIAASYNDLGVAYVLVDNDKALDYYEKALAIYQKVHGNEHAKIAQTYSNMGLVYRQLELYGDAVNNLESSLNIWEKLSAGPNQSKAFTLHSLGQTYSKMGNLEAAKGYYKRALDMYRASYGAKHPDIAQVLNDYGNVELSLSNYGEALIRFQEAICANVSNFNNTEITENPPLENYYNGQVLLHSLRLKAQAFESRHFGKSLRLSDLLKALNILQRCDTLIDRLRQRSTNESDKLALGAIASEVYADGVRTAYEAAAGALKKKPLREQAFYFAEKSKSAVLLEAISESDAKSFAGIPKNLLEEENGLKSAIALTAQKLAQKPSADEEKYLRETLFALNRTYETFVKKLEQDFPAYFNLKYNAASPSIRQIQNLLDGKTALLSYFIDEGSQRLYVFQITKSKYSVVDHSLPKDFDKNITGLRNGIYFNVANAYVKSANVLSRLLLPAIKSSVTNLVIVPTGRLGIIPFEALATKKIKGSESFANVPFLLNSKTVRYEFSAGLLLQKTKQTIAKRPSIFLCAPVTFPAKDKLNELPGTESEVNTISTLFDSRNITAKLITHQDANEHAIKSISLKDYSLLHFATHGVVDERSPELSRIFLQNNSESEDGNLFAGEIYNLEMNADLVTLSACQTGLGKISKGEGVIGLSRALVYAGAKSIIVSFWSVADESTSELMKTFYQRMLENPNAGYAANLRDAKLALITNPKYASPFYWAPFILIGY